MNQIKRLYLCLRLRWLERQINYGKFDRELSLKVDRLHAQLNNQDNEHKVIFWLARAWELVKNAVAPPDNSSSQEDLVGWHYGKRKL